MYDQMTPLTAFRAFEAAARHLRLTKAALELHVTAGALSHQIRALEEFIGLDLFERRVRSIALTPAGKLLYPGLHTNPRGRVQRETRQRQPGARDQHPTRFNLEMAGPAALPFRWRTSRNRRANFLFACQRKFRDRWN